MYIMNLIHDICLTKNSINSTPRWKFISKIKLTQKLNSDISEFLKLDVFSASENVLSFLLSLDRETTKHINGYLSYDEAYILIEVLENDGTNTDVTYYPRSNRFEIWNKYVSYTIYRNTKISNIINKMWEPLTNEIKERYLDMIIQMADNIITKPLPK